MMSMVVTVGLVIFASFHLIRHQVSSYFDEALRDQYGRQFEIFQTRQSERLAAVSNEIQNSTSNPRLMAALLESDYSRFYYDLVHELKAFYSNAEAILASDRLWPFFRFVDSTGRYLVPPDSSRVSPYRAVNALPDVASPFPEAELEQLLTPLRTGEREVLQARSGYLIARIDGAPVLLKAFVLPVSSAFDEFLGDLIVVMPWRGEAIDGADVLFAIVVEDNVFGATDKLSPQSLDTLSGELGFGLERAGRRRVEVEGWGYLIFSRVLTSDPDFPRAKQS